MCRMFDPFFHFPFLFLKDASFNQRAWRPCYLHAHTFITRPFFDIWMFYFASWPIRLEVHCTWSFMNIMVAFAWHSLALWDSWDCLPHSEFPFACSVLLFVCIVDELLEPSFRNAGWRTHMLKSDPSTWRIICKLDLPLALFRVQYGSFLTHKWHEGLKTTCGYALPLALFRARSSHAHRWREIWRPLRVVISQWLFSRSSVGARTLTSDMKIWRHDLSLTLFRV